MESLRILPGQGRKLRAVKRAMAEIQHSQKVKCHFVMRSSGKNDGQDFLSPLAAVTMASMGMSPHLVQ